MSDLAVNTAVGFWTVLGHMAPYLLFGFLMAGILSVFLSPETVERHLGGRGLWPVFKASAFGVPLPLCSCSVIPVAASLRRHGASRSASTAFLLSTPQTGVDSILVTYSLLGPVFAIFRPLTALVTGLVGGTAVGLSEHRDGAQQSAPSCEDACCAEGPQRSRMVRVLHYAFVTLARDIAKPLLAGLLIAGLIAAIVPEDYFAGTVLGAGVGAILIMMFVGIPVYVCATASVPIAATLMQKGLPPGAAFAFLVTGAATNAAAIATVWKVMGGRTAVVYLTTTALSALGFGLLLNALAGSMEIEIQAAPHAASPWFGYVGTASAVVLLGLLAHALVRPRPEQHAHEPPDVDADADRITLSISGMTCDHCANAVEQALRECSGVTSASVDLAATQGTVTGRKLDVHALCAAVESVGYKAGEEV